MGQPMANEGRSWLINAALFHPKATPILKHIPSALFPLPQFPLPVPSKPSDINSFSWAPLFKMAGLLEGCGLEFGLFFSFIKEVAFFSVLFLPIVTFGFREENRHTMPPYFNYYFF